MCRQGRAYWMHLLMASQEIGSRAEKLMGNMGYRMALKTKTGVGGGADRGPELGEPQGALGSATSLWTAS